jgi:hypothetical protein
MNIHILILLLFIIYYDKICIWGNDIVYNTKNIFYYNNNKILNNNKISNNNIHKNNKKINILIITYDNRENIEYINIHNKNINSYVKKWGYEYKFITKCSDNVYWCKIILVLDELKTNKYDYVVWLDSDTKIMNKDIDIGDILQQYNSDIFIGSDNNYTASFCAGVFIIKNTKNGIIFLEDCIKNVNKNCFNDDNSLNGRWASLCYEQGNMNYMIQ